MTPTAEQLLAEDGSVRVPQHLAASVHGAVLLHLAARARAGAAPSPPTPAPCSAHSTRPQQEPQAPQLPPKEAPSTLPRSWERMRSLTCSGVPDDGRPPS